MTFSRLWQKQRPKFFMTALWLMVCTESSLSDQNRGTLEVAQVIKNSTETRLVHGRETTHYITCLRVKILSTVFLKQYYCTLN